MVTFLTIIVLSLVLISNAGPGGKRTPPEKSECESSKIRNEIKERIILFWDLMNDYGTAQEESNTFDQSLINMVIEDVFDCSDVLMCIGSGYLCNNPPDFTLNDDLLTGECDDNLNCDLQSTRIALNNPLSTVATTVCLGDDGIADFSDDIRTIHIGEIDIDTFNACTYGEVFVRHTTSFGDQDETLEYVRRRRSLLQDTQVDPTPDTQIDPTNTNELDIESTPEELVEPEPRHVKTNVQIDGYDDDNYWKFIYTDGLWKATRLYTRSFKMSEYKYSFTVPGNLP